MSTSRRLLATLWVLLISLGIILAAFVWVSRAAGPLALVAEARELARRSSEDLAKEYQRVIGGAKAPENSFLVFLTDSVLGDWPGVEGGLWDPQSGFVAYAFPTHDGSAPKYSVPEAELPTLRALVERISPTKPINEEVRQGRQDVLALAAQRLPDGLVVWTMVRTRITYAKTLQRFAEAAAIALALTLAVAVWLLFGMRRWSGKLKHLEAALHQRTDPTAMLPFTDETDLDRLVEAINTSALRYASLRQETDRLTSQLAHAERLAALGRLAASLAHEIKNPLSAMRLRVESALAAEVGLAANQRQQSALEAVRRLIFRLDQLVGSLMALSQPLNLVEGGVDIVSWLRQNIEERESQAASLGVALTTEICTRMEGRRCAIDPEALGRALGNLLDNALQHSPPGGQVTVRANYEQGKLLIHVEDTGTGIRPDLQPHLFEPFVSGRAGGTGLGLAIAREIALAHGGDLRLAAEERDKPAGARFILEVPWPKF